MIKHLRKIVQAGWGLLSNGYIKGFLPGAPRLYTGALKHFCVPGLNCYSCPGALGACPIGALQAVLTERHRRFPFFVLGYLAAVGLLAGRFICGWLCLFGLLQELLYKVPTPKLTVPEKIDRPLRKLKYLVLAVLVVGLPLLYRTKYGAGLPFFCKYLCPLGAFYSLFQRVSLVRQRFDSHVCTGCGACAKSCAMGVDPRTAPNSAECIRCGECQKVCPVHALSFGAGKNISSKEQIVS